MIYPFKYNLTANTGFFRITTSSQIVYFKYDIINFNQLQITQKQK